MAGAKAYLHAKFHLECCLGCVVGSAQETILYVLDGGPDLHRRGNFEGEGRPVVNDGLSAAMSCAVCNMSSAVAEMGDRLAARDRPKSGHCCAPFRGGAGSPFNTMSPGPRHTSVPSGILIH